MTWLGNGQWSTMCVVRGVWCQKSTDILMVAPIGAIPDIFAAMSEIDKHLPDHYCAEDVHDNA